MRSDLLLVEPDPTDATLWRYGRADEHGRLTAYGLLRCVDGCIEAADNPGWPVVNDAVTAMCVIHQAH